jgi:hypothetical protein
MSDGGVLDALGSAVLDLRPVIVLDIPGAPVIDPLAPGGPPGTVNILGVAVPYTVDVSNPVRPLVTLGLPGAPVIDPLGPPTPITVLGISIPYHVTWGAPPDTGVLSTLGLSGISIPSLLLLGGVLYMAARR